MLESEKTDVAPRPRSLAEFIGQPSVRKNLSVFLEAAKMRDLALDHALLCGPPGLGKTTLARIIASELGRNFRATSGPIITKPGDLAALLTQLEPGDLLFIDEIHRLSATIEEILYPAMEDFELDLLIGEGPTARSMRIDLSRFTLVGATTRAGLLSAPLRDRFGIHCQMQYYTIDDLVKVVEGQATRMNLRITSDGAREISSRSRGTPRIAGRLLRRVRDFAEVSGASAIDQAVADNALRHLAVDHLGLDELDRRYLLTLAERYRGGPVGLETISASLNESRDVLEEVVEPFLLQIGLLDRSARGRKLPHAAWEHLGLHPPEDKSAPDDSTYSSEPMLI